MLNKLRAGLRDMVSAGDKVICAVSGGADSMALLWGMYLLKDQLGILLEAAHFNHGLRGAESDRDEAFVKDFCERFDIPLHIGSQKVVAGPKGLEAAAREARYAFFSKLDGKLATAHTADDNAETVLMHLIRGTGLKGLGGITPVRGNVIRPMLNITRQEILAFLEEYAVSFVEDSTNAENDFLRNRLRHDVMPLLLRENPRLKQDLSSMAQTLRYDEAYLREATPITNCVSVLRDLEPALQSRAIGAFLENEGVCEPSREHIRQVQHILDSPNPSARVSLPGGVVIERNYDAILAAPAESCPDQTVISCPGVAQFGGVLIHCKSGEMDAPRYDCFVVAPKGKIIVRSRQSGDHMRLHGGRKSLKKIFTDLKIPASRRPFIPVVADDEGVLGVYGIGANLDRIVQNGVQIHFEQL